ncbi:MAG: winged helix-turn-helix domain-containing protein [Actinomycetes bacterium]
MSVSITADQARRIALWRQELLGSAPKPGRPAAQEQRVHDMVRSLGAVQLDTISVLARTHELVAYARFGAVKRSAIEAAYWNGDSSFEYWSHAACILPVESWPLFSFRRRHYARRGIRWHEVTKKSLDTVLARLRSDGPLTTKDIGGAKASGYWWDWSDSKIAMEYLLDVGQVVCTSRVGWRRVYDLAERVIPQGLREQRGWGDDDGIVGPSDEECVRALVGASADVMGVGTVDDIADVHRLSKADVRRHSADLGLVPVTVRGWSDPALATTDALEWLDRGSRMRSRTTLLSPFDSIVWHRPRTQRLFGMQHRLEAYTPAPKRVHGYFAMPVLHRGALVARVDPKREGSVLVAARVTLEEGPVADAAAGVATALVEAARWVGCEEIRIDEVIPSSATREVRAALNDARRLAS